MSLRISEMIQRTPQGDEYLEVIIPPYTPGTNRKVYLQDILSMVTSSLLTLETVDVSGGTITLDLNSIDQMMYVGSASFGTPKTIALSNATNGLVIDFKFNLSNVAAVLTFPTSFTMQTTDLRWNDGAHTFTPSATGKHEFSATFDGTDWDLKITNPYA